jgi:hypothetical protein
VAAEAGVEEAVAAEVAVAVEEAVVEEEVAAEAEAEAAEAEAEAADPPVRANLARRRSPDGCSGRSVRFRRRSSRRRRSPALPRDP